MRKLTVACCSLACLLTFGLPGKTQSTRTRAKQKAVVGKPFTLERVIVRLQDVSNKEYTEAALLKKLEKDGIEFKATLENLSQLKESGGSPSLLALVRRLAPVPEPPPPPVPKPSPTGAIEAICAPAECLISISGKPPMATTEGKLIRQEIAPGDVPIQISKHGFVQWTSIVKVIPNEIATVKTVLTPNPETQEAWGMHIRDKVLEALGGNLGLEDARSVFLSGEATIWGHDGRKYTSSLDVLLRGSGKAFFRARSGKRSIFEADFLPEFRSKSNLPESEARDLDAGLRLFLKYQIPNVMQRLCQPEFRVSSERANVQDGTEIHLESGTERMLLTLNADDRPKALQEDAPFGKGIRALYSAYKPAGKSYYPTEISIVWPGSPAQGIAIEIRTLEVNPDVRVDSNYHLKRDRRFLARK